MSFPEVARSPILAGLEGPSTLTCGYAVRVPRRVSYTRSVPSLGRRPGKQPKASGLPGAAPMRNRRKRALRSFHFDGRGLRAESSAVSDFLEYRKDAHRPAGDATAGGRFGDALLCLAREIRGGAHGSLSRSIRSDVPVWLVVGAHLSGSRALPPPAVGWGAGSTVHSGVFCLRPSRA